MFCLSCNSINCEHSMPSPFGIAVGGVSRPSMSPHTEKAQVISLVDEALKRGDIQAPFKYDDGYAVGIVRLVSNLVAERGERQAVEAILNTLSSMNLYGGGR